MANSHFQPRLLGKNEHNRVGDRDTPTKRTSTA